LNTSQWFVWSDKTSSQIFQIVRTVLSPEEQCVVMAIHPEAAVGTAPQWIWEWLNDKMQRQFRGQA
jgi:hypothetical protein